IRTRESQCGGDRPQARVGALQGPPHRQGLGHVGLASRVAHLGWQRCAVRSRRQTRQRRPLWAEVRRQREGPMSVDALLARLEKVKGRNGSWTACCPAHADKSPSLAIKDEGGKVLVHCFGGCTVEAVIGAVGMDLTELFPPKEPNHSTPQPKAK